MAEQKFVYLRSRDSVAFRIPENISMKSEFLKFIENGINDFYINRHSSDVNNLIDYMSGHEYKQNRTLTELIAELKINVVEEKARAVPKNRQVPANTIKLDHGIEVQVMEKKDTNNINKFGYGFKMIDMKNIWKLNEPVSDQKIEQKLYEKDLERRVKLYDRILKETKNEEYSSILSQKLDVKDSIIEYVNENYSSGKQNDHRLKLLELELIELSKKNKIIQVNIFGGAGRHGDEIGLVTVKYVEEAGNMAIFKIINCEYLTCQQIKSRCEEFPSFELFDIVKGIDLGYAKYAILFRKI
jgi:hypothetical protein